MLKQSNHLPLLGPMSVILNCTEQIMMNVIVPDWGKHTFVVLISEAEIKRSESSKNKNSLQLKD